MAVMAIFAIGFAASGDDEEVKYVNGKEYHKVKAKCYNCGAENPYHDYWEDEKGYYMGAPEGNMIRGRYYCNSCLLDPDKIDKLKF